MLSIVLEKMVDQLKRTLENIKDPEQPETNVETKIEDHSKHLKN